MKILPAILLSFCALASTGRGESMAFGFPAVSTFLPNTQNRVGDNFDLNTAGGAFPATLQGGFGAFGNLYVNYNRTNLFLGAEGVDMSADNNALVLFLGLNTLDDDASNLWALDGNPRGLDTLHNIAFSNAPMDIAILIGSENADFSDATAPLANGYAFGQGVWYLSTETSNFNLVAGSRVSQFDGTGTIPTVSTNDDGNAVTDRWEVLIPWSALNVGDLDNVTSMYLCGVFVSDTEFGVDRYISGNYLAEDAASSQPLDAFNNFATNFVWLTPLSVGLRGVDSDSDGADDRDELVAGTDPLDGGDVLRIASQTISGTQVTLSWPGESNRTYTILARDDLLAGSATAVATGIPAAVPVTAYTTNVPASVAPVLYLGVTD